MSKITFILGTLILLLGLFFDQKPGDFYLYMEDSFVATIAYFACGWSFMWYLFEQMGSRSLTIMGALVFAFYECHCTGNQLVNPHTFFGLTAATILLKYAHFHFKKLPVFSKASACDEPATKSSTVKRSLFFPHPVWLLALCPILMALARLIWLSAQSRPNINLLLNLLLFILGSTLILGLRLISKKLPRYKKLFYYLPLPYLACALLTFLFCKVFYFAQPLFLLSLIGITTCFILNVLSPSIRQAPKRAKPAPGSL